ncbi:hypothetical protein SD457_22520 [Coprobacillaceae bacterium CR2/5/TPMF4]|nr:hypothetical protein SD457_22520 [Coprobacillaceae bacterium CR2/5/TPMF4]
MKILYHYLHLNHFSCKAIYQIAKEYGVGIDCVSAGEISVALKGGFDPKRFIFMVIINCLQKLNTLY